MAAEAVPGAGLGDGVEMREVRYASGDRGAVGDGGTVDEIVRRSVDICRVVRELACARPSRTAAA
mgnify:CR=1 FL=1